MKLLHISNKPVFPLVDGGCVAMAALLKGLTEISDDVFHCYIHTPKHPADRELYPSGTNFALADNATFINTRLSAAGAVSSFLKGRNYNLSRFFSETFSEALKNWLVTEKPDVIILESAFLLPYLAAIRSVSAAKVILRAHNVEHRLWQQQAVQGEFPKKAYLAHLARTLKREELKGLQAVDQVWTITPEDAADLRHLGIKTPIYTIPFAMETAGPLPDYSNADFFHLGALNWEPNKLAVNRLLMSIWPQFSLKSQSRLHIAGSFSDDFKMDFVPHVQIHGFAENAEAFMLDHGSLVVPVISGSGVRIKLLEAMALGIPCISTPLGAAGILNASGQLKLADSDEEWLAALGEFADSEAVRRSYGEKGKAYIEKYHSFAAVNAQMTTALGK